MSLKLMGLQASHLTSQCYISFIAMEFSVGLKDK